MKTLVENFPEQLAHALRIGEAVDASKISGKYQNIVVAGLGGSGIGGNIVESVLSDKLIIPLQVVRAYHLPAYVNEHTLFVACSFSGNTEETLACLKDAEQKNAAIACITAGGELLEIATKKGYTCFQIPGESKSPRACVGYSLIQLLYILYKSGLINESFKSEIENSITLLKTNKEHIRQEAAKLADQFYNKAPILYADTRFLPLIVRFQQQLNENSKHFCHVNTFPEMNHNELVGWMHPEKFYKKSVTVLIKSDLDHHRVRLRMDLCTPIFEERGTQVIDLVLKGQSMLEQAIYLINVGDWVSIYLAELNQVDPKPVKVIDYLKQELAKHD